MALKKIAYSGRKALRKLGIDVRKYRSEIDRLNWLKSLNIRSVLDVGANTGQFAAEIRKALPEAFIYSFEPLNDCFKALEASRANDAKFKAFNYALGENDSTSTIHRSSYSLSSSLLPMATSHKELFPHTKDNTPEKIEVRKMDGIFSTIPLEENILIKVDTQGYEDKVIAGGPKTFSRAKVLIMEVSFVALYEGQPLFDSIYQKLKALGFSYAGALHQKINPKTGEVIFEDAIFVRQ